MEYARYWRCSGINFNFPHLSYFADLAICITHLLSHPKRPQSEKNHKIVILLKMMLSNPSLFIHTWSCRAALEIQLCAQATCRSNHSCPPYNNHTTSQQRPLLSTCGGFCQHRQKPPSSLEYAIIPLDKMYISRHSYNMH
jgi:hypothetical protein